jgi:hypothetical protein
MEQAAHYQICVILNTFNYSLIEGGWEIITFVVISPQHLPCSIIYVFVRVDEII